MSPEPVFVGGCPRSGTTLLGSLLGSHTRVVCVPESQFKVAWIQEARNRAGLLNREHTLDLLSRNFRFRLWNVDLKGLSMSLPAEVGPADLINELVLGYAGRAARGDLAFWVDHTPNNIRHFELLAAAFPEARFIHIVRDPRAVATSLKKVDWGPSHSYTGAQFWLQQVSFGLAAESFLGDRVTRVRYEDLVCAPQLTLERLCAFLGLGFEPSLLAGNGFIVPRYSEDQHRLVGRPPLAERAGAWAHTLSEREVEVIEATCCDCLAYFGYSPVFGALARPPDRRERIRCHLGEMVRREVVNPWRLWRRRRLDPRPRLEGA